MRQALGIKNAITDTIGTYAEQELTRVVGLLGPAPVADTQFRLAVDPALAVDEVSLSSDGAVVAIHGGSSSAALHGVYLFLEKLGCVFELSGERLPERVEKLVVPAFRLLRRPGIAERGIRMHLNFVQDQSFFSEDEFARFIDNMARQRFNYLLFHMYTPQQWFPFSYRGVEHLDLHLGNLNRQPLAQY